MNKRDFLRNAGLASLAAGFIPSSFSLGKTQDNQACVLIPSETAGPFPLDLTANNFYFRQDIREGRPGVPFKLKMKINGIGNCAPMENVRVNIWHCTRDGLYSGYDNNMNAGQAGLTYLRGYQFTDANGEVEFMTIFPGWYNGRITHIHFQVYVSSAYAAISQMTFDIATKNGIYAANPGLYPNGADPMTLSQDNVFSDGSSEQFCTLTPNSAIDGYDGYFEVGIQGNGTVGVGYMESQNLKQFELGQNFPNPFHDQTQIPITLQKSSRLKIELFDLQGKQAGIVTDQDYDAGEHVIPVSFPTLGIASGQYVYQAEVRNAEGTFRSVKRMTQIM